MGNSVWEYKNKVLKDTLHLKLNTELVSIPKWNIECIEKRTKELIDRICDLYPYPKVKITDGNNEIVGENESLDITSDLLFDHSNFIEVEKIEFMFQTIIRKDMFYILLRFISRVIEINIGSDIEQVGLKK